MAEFNFHLNRQGPRGAQGVQGEQGFSPSITINSNTANEFTLLITNESDSFVTPNLRGDQVEDLGGTYLRFNQETKQMYAGFADVATEEQRGEVLLASDEDIELGSSGVVVTADQLRDAIDAAIESSGGDIEALRTELQGAIDNLTLSISTETTQRTLADNALSARIDSEVSTRESADTALSARIDNIVIPDISNLATKDELADVEAEIPDVSDFLTTTNVSTVALTGNYNDLSNKPVIPDVSNFATTTQLNQETSTRASEDARIEAKVDSIVVNDGNLTINVNGSSVGAFSANQVGDTTVNITTATQITDLSGGSALVTAVSDLEDQVTTLESQVTLIDDYYVSKQTDLTTTITSSDTVVPTSGAVSRALQNISVSTATTTTPGIVQPDGTSIVINNGIISATATGGVQIDDTTTTTNATWSSSKIDTSIKAGDLATLETVTENFLSNDAIVAGDNITIETTTVTTGTTEQTRLTISAEGSETTSADLTIPGLETFGHIVIGTNGFTNIGDYGYCETTIDTGLQDSDPCVVQIRGKFANSSFNNKQQFRLSLRGSDTGGTPASMELSGQSLTEWTGSTSVNLATFPAENVDSSGESYNRSVITYRFEFSGTSVVIKYKFDPSDTFTTLATKTLTHTFRSSSIGMNLLGQSYNGRNAQGVIYTEGTQIEDGNGNILWTPRVKGKVEAAVSSQSIDNIVLTTQAEYNTTAVSATTQYMITDGEEPLSQNLSNLNSAGMDTLVDSIVPDYSSEVDISGSLPFAAPTAGFVYIVLRFGTSVQYRLSVNGVECAMGYGGTNTSAQSSSGRFVAKGDVVTATGDIVKLAFYPLKGVN
jgi:hypothetical protein